MMRDCEATIGKLIDKQGVAFISSVDADASKKKNWNSDVLLYHKYLFHACGTVSGKSECVYLFL